VYNFEVEGFHSYVVGDSGAVVHNSCPLANKLPGLLGVELEAAAKVGATPISATAEALETVANQGTLKWAVLESGELVVSPHTVKGVEISHAVLSGGRAVRAAGHADVAAAGRRFVGIGFNAQSGHFGEGAVEIGKAAFAKFGITF